METRSKLREAFGCDRMGHIRPAGTTMQYASVTDRTLRRWIKRGLIARRGDLYVLTATGASLGYEERSAEP